MPFLLLTLETTIGAGCNKRPSFVQRPASFFPEQWRWKCLIGFLFVCFVAWFRNWLSRINLWEIFTGASVTKVIWMRPSVLYAAKVKYYMTNQQGNSINPAITHFILLKYFSDAQPNLNKSVSGLSRASLKQPSHQEQVPPQLPLCRLIKQQHIWE